MTRQNRHDQDRALTVVQPMSDNDTEQTAHLHITHLPAGFFPQLGHRFVRRWHQTFIDCPTGVALVIRDADGRVAAFLLGTIDQHAYVRHVLNHDRLALASRGIVGLVAHPIVAKRFFRTRARPYARRLARQTLPTFRSRTTASQRSVGSRRRVPVSGPIGVVHAVVTDPAARRAGYGRMLLSQFESELAAAGTPLGQLVTRVDGNAAEFYGRLGWRETARLVNRDGQKIIQFHRVVNLQ